MIRVLLLSAMLGGAALAAPDTLPPETEGLGVGTAPIIPGVPPGPPPPADQVRELGRQVGSGLRCPVCQGLSVADSQSATAVTIQNRINELVGAGYTDEQIRDYFVGRYGEWILLAPPAHGLNWLIWLGPGVALGLGLAWAASSVAAWRKEPDALPNRTEGPDTRDPYEIKLLEELDP